jgi:hypothetical protein
MPVPKKVVSVVLTYRLARFSVCLLADHRYTTFGMASLQSYMLQFNPSGSRPSFPLRFYSTIVSLVPDWSRTCPVQH